MVDKNKKWYRYADDVMIAGVCTGIAEYFKMDSTIVRLIQVFVTIFTGFALGILAYIVTWIIVSEKLKVKVKPKTKVVKK